MLRAFALVYNDGMSIRDIPEKIKVALKDGRLFFFVVVFMVALGAFGLGRLSLKPLETNTPVKKTVPRTSSQVAAPSATPSVEKATTSAVSTTEITEGGYVGSKNSTKYHLPWCSGAKRIKEENKVYFADKASAEKAGYTPAGNCPGI